MMYDTSSSLRTYPSSFLEVLLPEPDALPVTLMLAKPAWSWGSMSSSATGRSSHGPCVRWPTQTMKKPEQQLYIYVDLCGICTQCKETLPYRCRSVEIKNGQVKLEWFCNLPNTLSILIRIVVSLSYVELTLPDAGPPPLTRTPENQGLFKGLQFSSPSNKNDEPE